jgi:hypothetical protein
MGIDERMLVDAALRQIFRRQVLENRPILTYIVRGARNASPESFVKNPP